MQPADAGAKISTGKSPLRKVLDKHDTDKSSDQDERELHIEIQFTRKAIMSSYLKSLQFAIVAVILVRSEVGQST